MHGRFWFTHLTLGAVTVAAALACLTSLNRGHESRMQLARLESAQAALSVGWDDLSRTMNSEPDNLRFAFARFETLADHARLRVGDPSWAAQVEAAIVDAESVAKAASHGQAFEGLSLSDVRRRLDSVALATANALEDKIAGHRQATTAWLGLLVISPFIGALGLRWAVGRHQPELAGSADWSSEDGLTNEEVLALDEGEALAGDIRDRFRRACSDVRPLAEACRVTLAVDGDPAVEPPDIDAADLRGFVVRLVEEAVTSSEAGHSVDVVVKEDEGVLSTLEVWVERGREASANPRVVNELTERAAGIGCALEHEAVDGGGFRFIVRTSPSGVLEGAPA